MHPAIAVANYFFERAQAAGTPISGAQLQALSYFAHGLRLSLVNLPLLDEPALAGRDGIGFASITRTGVQDSHTVTALLTQVRASPTGLLQEIVPVLDAQDPALATLDMVWTRFGSFSAYDLGFFVRAGDSPWDATWNDPQRLEQPRIAEGEQADVNAAIAIPNSLIRRWFRKLLIQENRDQASADGLEQTVMAGRNRLEDTLDISPHRKLFSR